MKTLKILAAVVLSTFAVAAQSGPYGPDAGRGGAGMQERLKAADKNADGMISREEAQASLPRLHENFAAIDTNNDGQISLAEMQAARHAHHAGGPRGEGWKKLDANGDGRLSSEEVANAPRLQEHFKAIDTNNDGFLSTEEMQAARGHMRGKGRQG